MLLGQGERAFFPPRIRIKSNFSNKNLNLRFKKKIGEMVDRFQVWSDHFPHSEETCGLEHEEERTEKSVRNEGSWRAWCAEYSCDFAAKWSLLMPRKNVLEESYFCRERKVLQLLSCYFHRCQLLDTVCHHFCLISVSLRLHSTCSVSVS